MEKPADPVAQVTVKQGDLVLRLDYLYFTYQVLQQRYPSLSLAVYRILLASGYPLPPNEEDSQALIAVNLNDSQVRTIIDALNMLMNEHKADQQPSVQALYQDVITCWLLLARALLLIVLEQRQSPIH